MRFPSRHLFHLPLIAAFMALGLRGAPADAGMLWTMDGKTYEGRISLRPGQLAVTAADGQVTAVDLPNVLYASLHPPQPATRDADYLGPLSAHAIGSADTPGETLFTRGIYALAGGGGNIGGAADDFHFVSQGVFGNAEISVRLCDLGPGNPAAGIMFRESLQPGARQVGILVDGAGQLSLRCRGQTGAAATQADLGHVTLPLYLRLARADQLFRLYTSSDGANWTQVGGAVEGDPVSAHPIDVALPAGGLAGLAFAGGAGTQPGHASFDQFLLREGDAQPLPPLPVRTAVFRAWPHEAFLKGVLLREGTFLAGATLLGDAPTGIKVSWRDKSYPVDRTQLARVQKDYISTATFARIPLADADGRILSGGTGALLMSGDFLKGDITAFENDRLEINNIVFGLSSAKPSQVAAIAFHGTDVPPPGYRLLLLDGSILLAASIEPLPSGELTIGDPVLGRLTVPAGQLLSLQRTSGVVSLADWPWALGVARGDAEALTCFGRASSFWLASDGAILDRGLILPAGASITCHPPAGCRLLQTQIAVPQRLPQQAQLQFTITADGKEVYRSANLTSCAKSIPVSVALNGPQLLSLRVEAVNQTTVPAFGLWGNPLLVP